MFAKQYWRSYEAANSCKYRKSSTYLTTIADPRYFGRVVVPQRLINLSLLQKFNDTGGKVLKPKKISFQPQKKNMRPFFILFIFYWDFDKLLIVYFW